MNTRNGFLFGVLLWVANLSAEQIQIYDVETQPLAAQAKRLVESVQALKGEERIRAMFRQTYQRDPKDWELDSAELFIDQFVSYAAAWDRLAQALLVSNEMMFID